MSKDRRTATLRQRATWSERDAARATRRAERAIVEWCCIDHASNVASTIKCGTRREEF